jgi:protein-tyrosine phosphatase
LLWLLLFALWLPPPFILAPLAQEMPFTDGVPPPKDIINRFLALSKERFAKGNPDNNAIAVHCVAGLGR